jgi:hypothetical protein
MSGRKLLAEIFDAMTIALEDIAFLRASSYALLCSVESIMHKSRVTPQGAQARPASASGRTSGEFDVRNGAGPALIAWLGMMAAKRTFWMSEKGQNHPASRGSNAPVADIGPLPESRRRRTVAYI